MKKELWLRLKRYHFDDLAPAHLADRVRAAFGGPDASTQAFASKVARKLGWSRHFALAAIHEYKKFVYLGVVSETSVTPPKVIDQVWHEHLLFTRAYRDFCRDVIGRDFDHNPELVRSKDQTDVFQAQYAATLALYRVEFGQRPPADIWGTPKFKVATSPDARAARRKSSEADAAPASHGAYESEPLHTFFGGPGSASGSADAFETGGGGGFSGGGSSGSWGGDSGTDGGDSGSGGDSGGDGGGSGCSSSCGGGGE